VVKLSDDELRFLTGSDDPAAAREQLWHDGLDLMVVTMGSRALQFDETSPCA